MPVTASAMPIGAAHEDFADAANRGAHGHERIDLQEARKALAVSCGTRVGLEELMAQLRL